MDYHGLRAAHIADHSGFMNRVSLRLGPDPGEREGPGGRDGTEGQDGAGGQDDIPTDERLKRVKEGEEDLRLTELYFQYGRYLLLGKIGRASCRERVCQYV